MRRKTIVSVNLASVLTIVLHSFAPAGLRFFCTYITAMAPLKSEATIPESLANSARRKVVYDMQMSTISSAGAASASGRVRKATILKKSAMMAPPSTPMAREPMKMKQKEPTAPSSCPAVTAAAPCVPMLVVTPSCTTVLKRTIATASLSTDSPKMRAFSLGEAPDRVKMASVATGSTALISAEKASDSIGVSSPVLPPRPKYKTGAVIAKATSVPMNAKIRMEPMFEKNIEWLRE
mmetsp:Transcript_31047/g.75424  ORF Transcript_31047/g.75424 Transcript_31047/m.75424 type:complete len:236 (+) Transcript_31047:1110-1817(+)